MGVHRCPGVEWEEGKGREGKGREGKGAEGVDVSWYQVGIWCFQMVDLWQLHSSTGFDVVLCE